MCRVLKVSKSGYYAWRSRPESVRAKTDRELGRVIRRLHVDSKGVYGSPKIQADLHDEGFKVGRNRVARLMREAGLRGCPKRRFRVKSTKAPGQLVSSNLLAQNFHAEQANERWASDITYIHTTQGWLFLAIVMDLYSRRIVGWSMDRTMSRYLVIDALRMAIGCRQPVAGFIHHSDRGPQYTSDEFLAELKQNGMRPSMSGSGTCYDNAVLVDMRQGKAMVVQQVARGVQCATGGDSVCNAALSQQAQRLARVRRHPGTPVQQRAVEVKYEQFHRFISRSCTPVQTGD
jgi:putative transposase